MLDKGLATQVACRNVPRGGILGPESEMVVQELIPKANKDGAQGKALEVEGKW